ncbi:Bifunctional dihydroflavonol 4-reductase/flavanone 4-reductase [Heracleum sosnowskyi]|uniref:Bifunctional dihydroflavonol 4-reductase/flavanone 4-reductase n=1 Tax=Heracleum sosnowskyi TaxID=360622 RepID=A0AAD8N9Q3_9APIA|nr:Bifunctional dihydroflavonol 4-reductase/flavanone 4-reductase [Heracleum sosnowskyi]
MEGKMPVCVTGASGCIGSWLVKRLLERGYHVRATVRDPGLYITYPCLSIDLISLITEDEAAMGSLKGLNGITAVHVDDVCNAHIYLFENPLAKGRYICSSQSFNISDIAHSLRLKYPSIDIPDKFGVLDKTFALPCSSKKLVDLGFKFAHEHKDAGDLCAETIESCKDKGLI